MTRISLKEAYDNRDVIAWLVKHEDAIDELQNILRDIDPNGDLTNVVTKTGDQVIDGRKTFIGEIIADCDIIQNGAMYETHAEQIYSHNDYLIMRDGQLNGLSAGSYSGLQVKKYNGSDDVRMVVDNTGIMRVGDINDEKPLMVRDETGDMTSGNFVLWDGVNQKAITSSLAPGGVITGSGNIGSDLKPIKIVNGVATAVANSLVDVSTSQQINANKVFNSSVIGIYRDVGRNDLHLEAASPNSSYMSRLVVTQKDDGTCQLLLEKWTKGTDGAGNPYCQNYVSATTIATLS